MRPGFLHLCATALVALGLSGCGSSDLERVQQQLERQARSTPAANPTEAPDETRIGTLAPQRLTPGSCGMFLWIRSAARKMVLFADAAPGKGLMIFDGQSVELSRTLADGPSAFGHFTLQEFAGAGLTVTLDLTLDAREGMSDGVAVPQGSMRVAQADGWQIVLPVGGLVACQRG